MKAKKTTLATLIGLTLASGTVYSADFTRADVRYLSQSELEQRQPANSNTLGLGPLNFDSAQVYNQYNPDPNLPKITAYMSNWGQYARQWSPKDLNNVYDTIVFSFLGMCGTEVGDPEITSAIDSLKNYSCNASINPKAQKYDVIITDMWGDLAAAVPGMTSMIGYPENSSWETLMGLWYQGQDKVDHGILGALKKLHQNSPQTEMAFSIGGWSLSQLFSEMAQDPVARKTFVDSIVTIFANYPMFSQVDIDWEYPGVAQGGNTWSSNDSANYKLLVAELRAALDKAGKTDVKIAVAAGAPKSKIDASDLKGLVDEGVDIIHLMTYDFFGAPWAEEVNHHTNLFGYADAEWSVDDSVSYMIDTLDIDPKNIFIGYANYSRNATKAKLTSLSPLEGTYSVPAGKHVGGSWEKGTFEWYDIQQEFLSVSPENGLSINKGRHSDYQLLTDKEANADYIYSEEGEFFISLDTPRTVYAKAQYVKEKGLGGIFNWMADYDTGYMVNAAREGLGYTYKLGANNVDMTKIIFSCGENVATQEECEQLTNLTESDVVGDELEANAGIDITSALVAGENYQLDGSGSTGDGELTYKWKVTNVDGVNEEAVILNQGKTPTASIKIDDVSDASEDVTITIKLIITDTSGNTDKDTVVLNLRSGDNQAPVANAKVDNSNVEHGESFKLKGNKSTDADDDVLSYRWEQIAGESVSLDGGDKSKIEVNTRPLSNIDQILQFQLTVSDGLEEDVDTVSVHILSTSVNQAPSADISVGGDNVVDSPVTLDASGSSDDTGISDYQWAVSGPNGQSVSVSNSNNKQASFTPSAPGKYQVALVVNDSEGLLGHVYETVNIEPAPTSGTNDSWSSSTTYTAGDVVTYKGESWTAQWWTVGEVPGTTGEWGVWR